MNQFLAYKGVNLKFYDLLILKAIQLEQSAHGYQIQRVLRAKLGLYLSPSTIYPTISKLVKLGLIEPLPLQLNGKTGLPIKPYKLTWAGNELLNQTLTSLLKFITGGKKIG